MSDEKLKVTEIILDSGWVKNDEWDKPLKVPITEITIKFEPVDKPMRNVTPSQGLIENRSEGE